MGIHGTPSNAVRGTYPSLLAKVVANFPRTMDERLELAWASNGEALRIVLQHLANPLVFLEAMGGLVKIPLRQVNSWTDFFTVDIVDQEFAEEFLEVPRPTSSEITLAVVTPQMFGERTWSCDQIKRLKVAWNFEYFPPSFAPFLAEHQYRYGDAQKLFLVPSYSGLHYGRPQVFVQGDRVRYLAKEGPFEGVHVVFRVTHDTE